MTPASGLPAAVDQDSILRSVDRETVALLDRVLEGFLEIDLQGQPVLDGLMGGHVLTHLSREADRMADELLTATGRTVPPIDTDRRWDVERGGLRPGAVLIDDVIQSSERLKEALSGVLDWSRLDLAVRDIPGRRLVQLIIHHADLHRPWESVPEGDAAIAVSQLTKLMPTELFDMQLVAHNDPRAILAWASGRTEGADPIDLEPPGPSRRMWF